jgi:hypothetical protein
VPVTTRIYAAKNRVSEDQKGSGWYILAPQIGIEKGNSGGNFLSAERRAGAKEPVLAAEFSIFSLTEEGSLA